MKKNENVEVLDEMVEEPVKKENFLKRAWSWVKDHKKLFVGVGITALVAIVTTILVKNHGKINDNDLAQAVSEAIDLGAEVANPEVIENVADVVEAI